MSSCDDIRELLAEDGVAAAGQADIASHLKDCADCAAFLEALGRVDTALGDLPMQDAPDALAADTLRAVRRAADKGGASARPGDRDRWLAAGLAASVLIATGMGLGSGRHGFFETQERPAAVMFDQSPGLAARVGHRLFGRSEGEPERRELGLDLAAPESRVAESEIGRQSEAFAGAPIVAPQAEKGAAAEALRFEPEARGIAGLPAGTEPGADSGREMDIIAMLDAADRNRHANWRETQEQRQRKADDVASLEAPAQAPAPPADAKSKDIVAGAADSETLGYGARSKNEASRRDQQAQTLGEKSFDEGAAVAGEDKRSAAELRSQVARGYDTDRSDATVAGGWDDAIPSEHKKRDNVSSSADRDRSLAVAFLERHRSLDGLRFQEPVGYWANTYIPGDPAMRLLGAQLRGWNRAASHSRSGLERDVRAVRQPFDPPRDAALAVYLHADAPAIDGPTRLRVQVGLKGADRQGGRRPAMNVGLVIDLREAPDPDAGARIRALISALNRARQPEDRFSLTVAGPGGGLLVPPERFRHGPLRVAMERMFGAGREAGRPTVGLHQAIDMAAESVRRGDDPGAVLGSSLVILATGASLAGDLEALESMAHRNAVTGLPLSVIGLAGREDPQHIERLVAAGQGNRRILDSAQAADGLIDRELHAASRAVARAVRLRIRLAPGVRLVDVLGSRRLAEPQAERVREAERSIDQRLARNLGIRADRGEDEEGLQIVIPAFQAGDDHVILLDVVADRAGPIADVTARYKDVIHLRNGIAQASLTVTRGGAAAGPLELNVLKNLVAREYARRTGEAGRHLAAGDVHNAVASVRALRDLIHGLRAELAGWRSDPDLAADEAVLNDYLAVLAGPAVADAGQRHFVAASLRYAAFRKLQRPAR